MPDDLSGVVLDGRYRVIEQVAEGAMGVVYRAERVKLGRIVAVKILHDELPNELSSRKRFEIEAVAMAKLEHPHCAAVLDVGIHEDKPYVVMDFVSGQNLKDVIANGPLPAARAVEIVRQVLSGLAHAHEHGIIHRDIKPANVVLSQKAGLGDHVKILDFGLARLSADASNLTTGIVVGTPSYMAPEQIRGAAIDNRTDLYACGVLLFELLTGQKPFHSAKDDPIEVCSMHLKKPPPKLADMQPGIAFGELEAVVAKALAKSPAERYANAEEFAAALDVVPRRRTATPVAGVPVNAAASPSGWVAPSDGSIAAPSVTPTSTPVRAPAPGSELFAPSAPAPRASSPSAPARAPSPSAPPRAPSPSAPGAPSRAASPSSELFPNAGRRTPAVGAPVVPPAAPGLPPTFDLSAAIPREPTAAALPMAPGFDLAIPAPAAPETPILESSAPIGEATPRPATVAFLGAPPAGPSPLAATDTQPVTESAIMAEPVPRPARPPVSRRQLAIAAGGVVVVIAIIAIAARGGHSPQSTATLDAAAATAPPKQHPADDQLERANKLVADGRPDAAIEQLLAARKVFPDDARLAYLAGKLYFGKLWWSAGLKQFRDAIRLDPGFKNDPELIKTVLKGFILDDERPDLGAFLRNDIGAPAKQYLEETASTHPRAAVRARAAAELRRM